MLTPGTHEFTREELVNIRETVPRDLFPTFIATSLNLLDVLVKGARASKQWTREAVEDLQACCDCTDWDIFRTTTNMMVWMGTQRQ